MFGIAKLHPFSAVLVTIYDKEWKWPPWNYKIAATILKLPDISKINSN